MEQLFQSAVSTFGLRYLIIGTVIAGIAVWLLAHWNAQPGTQVSVVWGLVTYTKQFRETKGDLSKVSNFSPAEESRQPTDGSSTKMPRQGSHLAGSVRLPEIPLIFDNETTSQFNDGRTFIVFSKAWAESVADAVKDLTSHQKDNLLSSVLGDKWAKLTGVVQDVTRFGKMEIDVRNMHCYVQMAPDQKISKLSRGKSVTVVARFSGNVGTASFFQDGSLIEADSHSAAG